MEKRAIGWKGLFLGFFVFIVSGYSPSWAGDLEKKVTIPREVNGREVMQAAVEEGRSLNYRPQREPGKVVLRKTMPARFGVGGERTYQITLAIAPGDEGRKVLTMAGEYIGDVRDREIKACFECDLDQLEKAVQKKLESR